VAVDDYLLGTIQRIECIGQGVQRHQPRTRQSRDRPLVRLAHVQQQRSLTTREPSRQRGRRDLVALRVARGFVLARAHATECLIVDERADLAPAAGDALGIPGEVDRPESHAKRIDEEQSSGQRLADAGDQLDRLRGLDDPDQARDHSQHAAVGAVLYER